MQHERINPAQTVKELLDGLSLEQYRTAQMIELSHVQTVLTDAGVQLSEAAHQALAVYWTLTQVRVAGSDFTSAETIPHTPDHQVDWSNELHQALATLLKEIGHDPSVHVKPQHPFNYRSSRNWLVIEPISRC